MGLYKICTHKGRARDRCDHAWWGSFQHRGRLHRQSLEKWSGQEIRTKAEAQVVFDRMKQAVRGGRLQKREDRNPDRGPLTFAQFAQIYADKHARAKGLALAKTIDYRLKPLIEFFGPRRLTDIKTADIEDFIAELRKPRRVSRQTGRRLKPASINRHLELLRHMLNWAVGREYIDGTPFRRGSEVLIRPLLEDNKRSRRIAEEEEQRLLDAAPPMLRALIIAALDTGMRRGEMLALRFKDIDWKRRLIVLRGPTTKSRRTRIVPVGTERLLAVLEWLRLDVEGRHKPDDAPVFSDEVGDPVRSFRSAWLTTVGDPVRSFRSAWLTTVLKGPEGSRDPAALAEEGELQAANSGLRGGLPGGQSPLARPAPRVCVEAGGARGAAVSGKGLAGTRFHRYDGEV